MSNISGYWGWDDDRGEFLWVSGVWRVPPPGHHWIPGYWLQENAGWRWVSGYWAPEEEASIDLYPEPPDPIPEAIPVAPNQQSIYSPGCWVYQQSRYWWRPGFWVGARLGWTWVPAAYYWTPGGYVFSDGHWDYDLQRRGLAFAPVYFARASYGRPGWFYRPSYGIAADFLLGSLFINPGWNHYYFGDYYDPSYVRRGYYPWIDYRIGGRYVDPLYGYYRWQHRGDTRWENNLHTLYATRSQNKSARPPHTLIQQQQTTNNIQVVTSLNQINRTALKLQPVSKAQVQTIQAHAAQVRTLSQKRGKIEVEARTHAAAQKQQTPAPVKVAIPRPKQGGGKAPVGDHAPPPKPVVPKVQPHSVPKGKGGNPDVGVVPMPPNLGKPPPKGKIDNKGKPPPPLPKFEPKPNGKGDGQPGKPPPPLPKLEPKQKEGPSHPGKSPPPKFEPKHKNKDGDDGPGHSGKPPPPKLDKKKKDKDDAQSSDLRAASPQRRSLQRAVLAADRRTPVGRMLATKCNAATVPARAVAPFS